MRENRRKTAAAIRYGLAVVSLASCAPAVQNVAPTAAATANAPAPAETHRYCGDLTESADGYRCNDELTAEQQERRDVAWDFVYRGSRLARVDRLNGRGVLSDPDNRCASWRAVWQAAVLVGATCSDRNGTERMQIHYESDGTLMRWSDYLGRPDAEAGGHVAASRRSFDQTGRVVGLVHLDESRAPAPPRRSGLTEIRWKRNADGIQVERSFYDERGQPAHDQAGVHRYTSQVDGAGRVLARRSFDEQGRAIVDRDGVHLVRHAYDDVGNIIRTSWYGVDERPVRGAEEGAAAVSIIRDQYGAEIERRNLDENRDLTLGAGRYAIRQTVVNKRGLPVTWTHFGVDDAPVRRIEGYFKMTAGRDGHGNIAMEDYFDTDGRPVTRTDGAAHTFLQRDSRDNVTRVTTLDPGGTPVETTAGFAIVVHEYDGDRLVQTRFYDAQGRPVNSADGFARVRIIYDAAGAELHREFATVWPKPPSHPWRNAGEFPKLAFDLVAPGEKADATAAAQPVTRALAASDTLGASDLLAATINAYRLKRIEDAAFLYEMAVLRIDSDLARFVPKDRGSDSPAAYQRALLVIIGSVITPAIGTRPEAFGHVLERLRGIQPRSDPSYRPEWETTEERPPAKWRKHVDLARAKQLQRLEMTMSLLRDRQFLACSRIAYQKHLNPRRHQPGSFQPGGPDPGVGACVFAGRGHVPADRSRLRRRRSRSWLASDSVLRSNEHREHAGDFVRLRQSMIRRGRLGHARVNAREPASP